MKVKFNPEKISLPPGTSYAIYGTEVVEVEKVIVKESRDWAIDLAAGDNELSDQDFERLSKSPDYDWFLTQSILVVGEQSAPPTGDTVPPTGDTLSTGDTLPPGDTLPTGDTPPTNTEEIPDIANLSIPKAEPIIEAETRIHLLKQWLNDPRTGIKDLVGDRLLELGVMPDV